MNAFIRASSLVQGKVTRSSVLGILFILRRCFQLGRRQGQAGLARYLKACSIYTMRYVAGDALHNSAEFGPNVSLTSGGLPRILPPRWREALRGRDPTVIRLTLTIFGLYRVLDFKGKLDTKTITSPGKGKISSELERYLPVFVKSFLPQWDTQRFGWDPIPLLSKGAHVHTAVFGKEVKLPKGGWTSQGALASAIAAVEPHLPDLKKIARSLGLESEYESFGALRMALGDVVWRVLPGFRWGTYVCGDGELPVLKTLSAPSGRLAVKEEPGKVRVFAMVDAWTQWFLYPLHKRIFNWLSTLSTDATFDQRAAVNRAMSKIDGKTKVFSFDLSAATDRLPAQLQSLLLSAWRPGLGDAWRALLVERDYRLPRQAMKGRGASVRYSVGQPMGAYSSWAMLAMTHHAIVQFSARKGGVTDGTVWFQDYAVLGDDVIIWEKRVAQAYLAVMQELGVDISSSKSLSSGSGVFEFAKRFVVAGVDCSAVPLAALAASSQNLAVFAEVLKMLPTRSISVIFRFLGFGYKVLGGLSVIPFGATRRAWAAYWALQPGICLQSVDRWSQWFVTTGPATPGLQPSWFGVLAGLAEFINSQRPKMPAEVPFFFSQAYLLELKGAVGSQDSFNPNVPIKGIPEVEVVLAALFHGAYSELFVRNRKRVREFDTLFEQTCVKIGPEGVDEVMALRDPAPSSTLLSTGQEQSPAWSEFVDLDRKVLVAVTKWIRFRVQIRNALGKVQSLGKRSQPGKG